MHGFSHDIPLKKLVGLTLIQICIGANEVILRFSENTNILVQSFEKFVLDNHLEQSGGKLLVPYGLGKVVEDVSIIDKKLVKIAFSGGCILLGDDSDQFESLVLELSGSRYIV
ncbi:MAG TPA: hypothetical protein VF645_03090 [Allosphingosinicella sp.]|jgi:hypothetical protein